MRTLLIIALLALLLGVGLVALIQSDPGYVLIAMGRYTVESSLWVGLPLILMASYLLFALLRLLFHLLTGRHRLANWWGARLGNRAQRNTAQGLVSFVEGHWSLARRQLLRGAQDNESALVNYLLAARASDRLEEQDRVAEYLSAAGEVGRNATLAVAITDAELQLRAGDYAHALATLEAAGQPARRSPRALELMREAHESLGHWDELLALLPALGKRGHQSAEELQQLERSVHLHRLQGASAGQTGASALPSVWNKLPSMLKEDPQMLHCYVRRLIECGADAEADKTIVRALKHHWDPELVTLYGLLDDSDSAARLLRAERWLDAHPDDPALLLCLGRLSARDKLWGKARDYYETCYRLAPTTEVCAELGRLLTELGEPGVAAAYFRDGMRPVTAALPDLPMPERTLSEHQALLRG